MPTHEFKMVVVIFKWAAWAITWP